jgi:CheY-like chemotaxis protein
MSDRHLANILLVDDREENLLALEAILGSLGHRLLRASSGQQALKHLLTEDVSLILLDVQMPDMDGYETAAHIKSRPLTQDIPIIFLTAIDREAHQAYRGYAAGAVDFLAKPFDPWVLRAKVEVFVRLQSERRDLQHHTESLRRSLAALDSDALSADVAEVERVLHRLHEDGPGTPGPAPELAQALKIVRSVRRRLQATEPAGSDDGHLTGSRTR